MKFALEKPVLMLPDNPCLSMRHLNQVPYNQARRDVVFRKSDFMPLASLIIPGFNTTLHHSCVQPSGKLNNTFLGSFYRCAVEEHKKNNFCFVLSDSAHYNISGIKADSFKSTLLSKYENIVTSVRLSTIVPLFTTDVSYHGNCEEAFRVIKNTIPVWFKYSGRTSINLPNRTKSSFFLCSSYFMAVFSNNPPYVYPFFSMVISEPKVVMACILSGEPISTDMAQLWYTNELFTRQTSIYREFRKNILVPLQDAGYGCIEYSQEELSNRLIKSYCLPRANTLEEVKERDQAILEAFYSRNVI